jgi:hypothetical protein
MGPEDETESGGPTVVVPGHEISPEELPKMASRAYNLLDKNGWIAKAGYAQFRTPEGIYGPKAAKAGEAHGGESVDNNWIEAVHPTRQERLVAVWHDGSFEHALHGLGLPRKVNSLIMNKIIKGEE